MPPFLFLKVTEGTGVIPISLQLLSTIYAGACSYSNSLIINLPYLLIQTSANITCGLLEDSVLCIPMAAVAFAYSLYMYTTQY